MANGLLHSKTCSTLLLCISVASTLVACQSPWALTSAVDRRLDDDALDPPLQSDWRSMDEGAPFVTPAADAGMGVAIGRIVVDAHDAEVAYASTQAGWYITADRVGHWQLIEQPIGSRLVVDPTQTRVAYGSLNGTLAKTDDGGRSWADAQGGLATRPVPSGATNFSSPMAVGQHDSSVIYAAVPSVDGPMLARSTDGGSTWSDLPPFGHGQCCDKMIAVSAERALLLKWEGFLATTSDGGQTWASQWGALGSVFVDAFAIDPNDSTAVYVVTRFTPSGSSTHGLSKSVDGGETWSALSASGLPKLIHELAIDSRGTLYVTANATVQEPRSIFVSTDRGDTFVAAGDGLGNNDVTAIATGPECVVYAGTASGGVFKTINGAGTCPRDKPAP